MGQTLQGGVGHHAICQQGDPVLRGTSTSDDKRGFEMGFRGDPHRSESDTTIFQRHDALFPLTKISDDYIRGSSESILSLFKVAVYPVEVVP